MLESLLLLPGHGTSSLLFQVVISPTIDNVNEFILSMALLTGSTSCGFSLPSWICTCTMWIVHVLYYP